jgi:uncharacterized DUF497 family protein
MTTLRFEWDPAKERLNLAKHRLSFTEACHVFADPFQLNLFDEDHSDNEERWVVIGEIPALKVVVVVHTVRYGDEEVNIRIIWARKATKRERETYFARRTP